LSGDAKRLHRRVLVLGGARSGKSRYAQTLAESTRLDRIFIATAQAYDAEMSERIARHRSERPAGWSTREEPLALAAAVRAECCPHRVVLADCLTLWLSNVMLDQGRTEDAAAGLVAAVRESAGPLILVSNEVGQGIVPATALGRTFRDAQGWLNQAVATCCDAVVLVTAGCPQLIKPARPFALDIG
jgi:adenosylcobinamide kinase/adenosylcobinamide-phosphate guanylyltransferase